ncbi:MAG: lipoyl(octanoyl) transferase LipB [Candidatus Methylomirabilales bacterium]
MHECEVYWLGRMGYGEALKLQRERASARIRDGVKDCLLLVEHPPVITLGRGAKPEHLLSEEDLLKAKGIEVWEIERGGDVTFHGPGQLVGYPVIELSNHGKDLHLFMRKLEEVIIRTLDAYGIRGEPRSGQTGVWVHGAKIASMGVHVSRWVSRHGFALNVSTDLSYFDLIVPCGITDVRMTSMTALLGQEIPIRAVAETVGREFGLVFDCIPRWQPHRDAALSLS